MPEIDRHLRGGLDEGALHEVKPERRQTGAVIGDWMRQHLALCCGLPCGACTGFVPLHPAHRRKFSGAGRRLSLDELGRPYGPGLSSLGLEPSSCLFVETACASDALWAMEEGLKSASVALVLGVLKDVELTPARRLSLAAAAHRIPCLFLTDPRTPPTGATATRWRIGGRTSAPHPFEAVSPPANPVTVSRLSVAAIVRVRPAIFIANPGMVQ